MMDHSDSPSVSAAHHCALRRRCGLMARDGASLEVHFDFIFIDSSKIVVPWWHPRPFGTKQVHHIVMMRHANAQYSCSVTPVW